MTSEIANQANGYYKDALDANNEPVLFLAYERATVLLEDTRRLLELVTINDSDQATDALTNAFFIDFVKLVGHSMQDDVRIKSNELCQQIIKSG